mmetsp:Transcript_5230/g.10053  ORF Transcript_5230/g.10053 Transcript_5230/m.10053 type:complete len:214 (+) Transcript_5230:1563-2204(+)
MLFVNGSKRSSVLSLRLGPRRIHMAPGQGFVQGLRRWGQGDRTGQNLASRHGATIEFFIDFIARNNDLSIQRNAGIKSLRQRIGINRSDIADGGSNVSFQRPTKGTHGYSDISSQLHRSFVTKHHLYGMIRHKKEYVIRDLSSNEGTPRYTRRADGRRCRPSVTIETSHDQPRSKFYARQTKSSLDDGQKGDSFGFFQQSRWNKNTINLTQIG